MKQYNLRLREWIGKITIGKRSSRHPNLGTSSPFVEHILLLPLGIKSDTEKQNEQKQWVLPDLLVDQNNHSKTTENKYSAFLSNSHFFHNTTQKRAIHLGKTGSICV